MNKSIKILIKQKGNCIKPEYILCKNCMVRPQCDGYSEGNTNSDHSKQHLQEAIKYFLNNFNEQSKSDLKILRDIFKESV